MSWVAAQTALMAAIAASWFFPPWVGQALAVQVAGGALVGAGAALILAARTAMGSSFTVRPEPRTGGRLVTRGPFRLVRHPVYLGALLCFAGGSLLRSWTGLGLTAVLAVLWGAKARVEERYLNERFAEYGAYRRRVRYRLVPFLY